MKEPLTPICQLSFVEWLKRGWKNKEMQRQKASIDRKKRKKITGGQIQPPTIIYSSFPSHFRLIMLGKFLDFCCKWVVVTLRVFVL
jgi:hypothetical protein